MKTCGRMARLIVGFLLACGGVALAQQDADNCKDHPLFTRMQNFYIDDCEESQFDAVDFKDAKGQAVQVEGKVYKLDYAIREGVTPPSALQVIRNYENAIKKIGGSKIYQEESYEIWLQLEQSGKTFWVHVDSWHGGGKGETYGLTIVEKESMSQQVVADASALLASLQAAGHASVYGIYFDLDKADIKPESQPAIEQIAALLKQNPALKLYVVGHTDNTGKLDYNMKLSQARAEAVVRELTAKYAVAADRLAAYGVASLAPVASNATDDGRARNRRVELVQQ